MNPKTTPNQPLEIEIERKIEIEKENKIKNKIEIKTEKESKTEAESKKGSSIISNNIISNSKLNNSSLSNSINISKSTITKAQSEPPVHPNIKDDGDFLSSIMLDDDDDMTSNCVGGSMNMDDYWEMRLKMGLGM